MGSSVICPFSSSSFPLTAEAFLQLFPSRLQLSLPFDCLPQQSLLCHTCNNPCCTILTPEPVDISLFPSSNILTSPFKTPMRASSSPPHAWLCHIELKQSFGEPLAAGLLCTAGSRSTFFSCWLFGRPLQTIFFIIPVVGRSEGRGDEEGCKIRKGAQKLICCVISSFRKRERSTWVNRLSGLRAQMKYCPFEQRHWCLAEAGTYSALKVYDQIHFEETWGGFLCVYFYCP